MRNEVTRALKTVVCLAAGALGCGDEPGDMGGSWEALLNDGDLGAMPGATTAAPAISPPPRFCSDCAREPLAFWTLDDCNTSSTQLADSAFTSSISHPAFRAVSVACVAGASSQAVKLAGNDDIVYAPDQPDFVFDQGLTIAAWIKANSLNGTQSIVRKRFAGTSSFTLAIDDKKLNFVVRLGSGKLVGVTASIKADRLTHVAATYDGQRAQLYIDGALAAKTNGSGKIAPGAGPILIGNDADGRQFKGIIDEIWLNTLAAPADAVKGLTCIRKAPIVKFTPLQSPATPPNTPVAFDLSVKNPSGASCPVDTFQFFASSLPFPLTADPFFGIVSAGPGQTVHATVNVSVFDAGASGPIPFQYLVGNAANFNLQATASATFVVAAPPPPMRTGCAATPTAPVAPGGYYVNGNTVCTAEGRPHLFHGIDRASLEWNSRGEHISLADFQLMQAWKPNVVRIALNQDFWLSASPNFDPSYIDTLDNAVAWAEMAGMDVILDLHWSDAGVLGSCPPAGGCQQLMPDANSVTFWSEVAAHYKNDGRVMFELYNEPHDVSWQVWKFGGDTGQGWQAAGMQQLYDTVRATGAQNLVIIGGLDWAYDLSGVPANRIAGYNIAYATHPYTSLDRFLRPPSDWNRAFGSLTATDPVIVTEFGVLDETTVCTTDFQQQVITYADAHFAGWTSWWWYPAGCLALISDWSGTPTPVGNVIRGALLGYDDPPASPPRPLGPGLGFTFNHGLQGWEFNLFDGGLTNLAVTQPPGVPPPALAFNAADGNPDPGSLQVTVKFSDLDQYVDPNVDFGNPGLNLSGKVLHARIKLVSGSFAQGAFLFHASTGESFVYGSSFFSGDTLPLGVWVTVDLDLAAVAAATPGYDPSQVVQIGVQLFSGFSGGGPFVDTGPTVFEIDTVTD